MSEEIRYPQEEMDISDESDESSQTIQVLRLRNAKIEENNEDEDVVNKQYEDATIKGSKNVSLTQNATDSHPLMYSSTSPISPDFPDLIPEKPKNKVSFGYYEKQHFTPDALSSPQHSEACEEMTFEKIMEMQLPSLEEYDEKLPDIPDSPTALKKVLMYDMSVEPHDISDTENEKSVYEAHLSSNFQNVSLTMNDKEGNLNFLAHTKKSNKLRKIKVVPTDYKDDSDISSIDSNPDSLNSEDVFQGGNHSREVEGAESEQKSSLDESPEPIEPLSAADERKHARHWQRMVLPSGEDRTIDMRVIEPYKRVLSHGGYLRAGGHTAIVIFSACYLPDKSRVDYDYVMDNLFLYVLWTLERLVTDDYVLVYLHGAATKLPSFSWLKRCYQMVGRKLRKNLTHLYLVHPTLWIKTMLFMAKPFISSKFYRKLTFVGSLKELSGRVPLEAAAIPDKVKAFDSLHCRT